MLVKHLTTEWTKTLELSLLVLKKTSHSRQLFIKKRWRYFPLRLYSQCTALPLHCNIYTHGTHTQNIRLSTTNINTSYGPLLYKLQSFKPHSVHTRALDFLTRSWLADWLNSHIGERRASNGLDSTKRKLQEIKNFGKYFFNHLILNIY